MKLSSFNNRVAYSPLLEARGYGVYGLRGCNGRGTEEEPGAASVADDTPRPGDLEHFRPTHRR